jgi:hypothetical protein
VRGSAVRLTGEAHDEAGVQAVTVCLDDEMCDEADLGVPGSGDVWWSHWLMATTAEGDAAVLDYVTKTVSIGTTDRLGNSTEDPQRFAVVFDNVAPVLEVDQLRAQALLRSASTVPSSAMEAALRGRVSDGGRDVQVSVRVQPPGGEMRRDSAHATQRLVADRLADVLGQHTLWVDAKTWQGTSRRRPVLRDGSARMRSRLSRA